MEMSVLIVFQLGMLIGTLIYVGRMLDTITEKLDRIIGDKSIAKKEEWSKAEPATAA